MKINFLITGLIALGGSLSFGNLDRGIYIRIPDEMTCSARAQATPVSDSEPGRIKVDNGIEESVITESDLTLCMVVTFQLGHDIAAIPIAASRAQVPIYVTAWDRFLTQMHSDLRLKPNWDLFVSRIREANREQLKLLELFNQYAAGKKVSLDGLRFLNVHQIMTPLAAEFFSFLRHRLPLFEQADATYWANAFNSQMLFNRWRMWQIALQIAGRYRSAERITITPQTYGSVAFLVEQLREVLPPGTPIFEMDAGGIRAYVD